MRTPKTWIYPLSGNDADLSNPDLTDHEVVIVEEMVSKKDSEEINMSVNPQFRLMVQEDALNIDQETFEELVTVATEAKVLDLSPNNYIIDNDGKAVLIDLEDPLAHKREEVEKLAFYKRPLKRFKFRCFEDAAAYFGVAKAGLWNGKSFALSKQGKQLQAKGRMILKFKSKSFEIGAVSGAIALVVRRVYHMRKTSHSIARCREEMNKLVIKELIRNPKAQDAMADSLYIELARKAVEKIRPREAREEIVTAFATIAMAEPIEKEGSVTILGEQYASFQDAVKKSIALIYSVWKADWSIPSKIMRGAKATIRGARSLYKWIAAKPEKTPVVA